MKGDGKEREKRGRVGGEEGMIEGGFREKRGKIRGKLGRL